MDAVRPARWQDLRRPVLEGERDETNDARLDEVELGEITIESLVAYLGTGRVWRTRGAEGRGRANRWKAAGTYTPAPMPRTRRSAVGDE